MINQATSAQQSLRKLSVIVLSILLVLSFLAFYHGGASRSYSFLSRNWGFNQMSYYRGPYIFVFYAFLLFTIFPQGNRLVLLFFKKAEAFSAGLKKYKIFLFMLISLLAMLLFYFLRIKYCFLGDMNLRIGQTMNQQFLFTEYLTMKALYYSTLLLQKFHLGTEAAFKLVSILAGGLFVFANCLTSDLLGQNRFQKLVYLLGSISTSLLLVFCGYLEIYAIPCALSALYLYFVLRYATQQRYFTAALLSLLLAIGSHLLCVAFAPSLLVAWYRHHSAGLSFISGLSRREKMIYIVLGIVAAIGAGYKIKSGFIMPFKAPFGAPNYLTLLSGKHIWEFINSQVLACGASFIAVICLLIRALKVQLNSRLYVLLAAYMSTLLMVFVANLHRGSGDWDISAFTGISINFLVVGLFFHLYAQKSELANYLLVVLLAFNSLNAFTWIHINHTDRSITKIEDMIETDPAPYYTSKLPGIIQLLFMLQQNQLNTELERLSQKACNTIAVKDARGCVMYADILAATNRKPEALSVYESLIERNPYVPQAYSFMANMYHEQKRDDKVFATVKKFYSVFKMNPAVYIKYTSPEFCINAFSFLYQNERNFTVAQKQELLAVIERLKTMMPKNSAKK